MGIIVQKFGGTSTGAPARRRQLLRHVAEARDKGYECVVVVSAMGRRGDPYATDTLRSLAGGVPRGRALRELDLLMSCGETIAATVVALELTLAGYDSLALTGGQAGLVTDNSHGNAKILDVRPDKVKQVLQQGLIPVVAGFQGETAEGDITTLGRGAGDTTAVALAVALNAELVEIYTDVDGIMTADPRIEPHATRLDTATYREILEMAHLGARVVHPQAMEIAMEARIPLRIRATGSKSKGTLVHGTFNGPAPLSTGRVVTGIAHVVGMAQVELEAQGGFDENGLLLGVFQKLASNGISLDMIYVSLEKAAFIVEENCVEMTKSLLGEFPAIVVKIQPKVAKISAVGAGMRGVPGVMAQVVEALQKSGVTILQTTDSHANISCLVQESHVKAAVQALHAQFGLGRQDNSGE